MTSSEWNNDDDLSDELIDMNERTRTTTRLLRKKRENEREMSRR